MSQKAFMLISKVDDIKQLLNRWTFRNLIHAPDTAKWKKLAQGDLRGALRKPTLDASTIVLESPQKIVRASKSLSNRFWAPIWQKLPTLNLQ